MISRAMGPATAGPPPPGAPPPPRTRNEALGLIAYGAGRFFVESYRDRRQVAHGFLTEGQLGCLASIAAGWTLLMVIPSEPGTGGTVVSLPEAFAGGLPLFPYALAAAAVVLVVMGSHWKRIGTW